MEMKIRTRVLLFSCLVFWPCQKAFTYSFIDVGSRLELDSSNQVTFYLADTPNPPLKDAKNYAGGRFANLNDRELLKSLVREALKIWNDVPGAAVTMVLSEISESKIDKKDGKHVIAVGKMPDALTGGYATPQRNPDYPNARFDLKGTTLFATKGTTGA